MPNAGMAAHWTARLRHIAAQERVPGAALGVWADASEGLAAHGVLNAATGGEPRKSRERRMTAPA